MKKILLILVSFLSLIMMPVWASFSALEISVTAMNNDSIENARKDSIENAKYWESRRAFWKHYDDSIMQEQLKHQDRYVLYPTENLWNFIELDTETGRTWQVQYGVGDSGGRMKVDLDTTSKLYSSDVAIPGRFVLYPTQNMYNFIMLDKIDGRVWQVQWNTNPDKRFSLRIY